MIALLAAGHLFVTLGKLLFMLPADPKTCSVSMLRYGPSSGKWERGSNPPQASCEFHQYVEPGALLPVWGEAGPGADDLEVTFQLAGQAKSQTVTLHPEPFTPSSDAKLSSSAKKTGGTVRVAVKNEGDAPVLIGDVVAARNKPKDECLGNGPEAAIAAGETLVDLRPGILSKSMKAYVAVFTDEKSCRWAEVAIH